MDTSTSCLRVCWQPAPWQGVGLEMEGLELELSVRGNSALLSGCHLPVRGRVWSQVTGAAALRFGRTCPLSVCFPCAQSEDMLKHMGPLGAFGSCQVETEVQAVSDALAGQAPAVFFPSTEMQPWIQVSLVRHRQSLPPAPAARALVRIHTPGQFRGPHGL